MRFALPFTVADARARRAGAQRARCCWAPRRCSTTVHVDGLSRRRVVVVLGLTLLTTLFGGVLALDRGDLWYRHVVRRQLKRSQLAEQHRRARRRLPRDRRARPRRAAARAARRQRAGRSRAGCTTTATGCTRWETDWSSQTGACQAGLLHGDDDDMPAFRWWEKDTGRAIVTNHPRDAAEIERRHSDGRGPAARRRRQPREHPLRRRAAQHADDEHGARPQPPGPARAGLLRLLRQPVRRRAHAAARRSARSSIERCVGDPAGAPRRAPADQARLAVRAACARFATVIQLDLQVAAVTADILAGRPVVYTTFLAYDEVAHHSGVERPGHAGGAAPRRPGDRRGSPTPSPHAPRPYQLVVLSDHGQSQGATFLQRYGEALEDIVRRSRRRRGARRGRAQRRGPRVVQRRRRGARRRATRAAGHAVRTARRRSGSRTSRDDPAIPDVSVMASGNLGLITFPREPGPGDARADRGAPPGADRRAARAPGDRVRARALGAGPVVLGPRAAAGSRRRVEGEDPLAPFGPHAADARRAAPTRFPHCPDIMVNSPYWEDLDEVAAFEELVGSHGGLGGGAGASVRARPAGPAVAGRAGGRRRRPSTAIFRGWLAELGQDAYRSSEPPGASVSTRVGGSPATCAPRTPAAGRSAAARGAGRADGKEGAPVDRDRDPRLRRARSPARRPRGRGARGRATGPSPRSGSARRRRAPRSASISGSRSVSPANQMPSTR